MFTKLFGVVFISLFLFFGCASSDYKVQILGQQTNETESSADIYGLAIAGAGMLVADFFLQASIHEGTHAILSSANGYKITGFYPYPEQSDEFGFSFAHYTGFTYDGERPNDEAFIKIAPKIVDLGILSSYALLEEFDILPENQYAQLAMWTIAFGAWIDFSRDFCSGICYKGGVINDLVEFERYLGYTSPWEKFAVRGSIVLLAGLSAYPLYNGLRKIIDPSLVEDPDLYDGLTVGPGMIGYKVEF